MIYTKDTMWVDTHEGSDHEPMTSAEVREYYISEYEGFCGYTIRDLWDDVVMGDNVPSRHHTQLLEQWLLNTTLKAVE